MAAELDSVVAAHPGIAEKFSIGQSYEGRELWALKISDNVATDENDPEVLFEALHHAREHLVVEMSLYIIHLLTDNYSASPGTPLEQRVSDIVNSREIWIIPMVNPDGAEYDITGGSFQNWRKNRQPIPGSSQIGVDLNRNWGYKWGCCNGSSGDPAAITYRGPSAWFAPEIVALRDFVLSRRIDGRQQITESISWHTHGELVLWPFGYTTTDIPKGMTVDDHLALVAIGQQMASLNGYTPEQASDLYITDGTAPEWLYGSQRIFAYTIEMYPPANSNLGDFYPPDSVIAAQTSRNQEAVLYFLEQADCPHRAAGLNADCGPLYDDFETDRGWTVNPHGTDTATTGMWERAKPQKTRTGGGVKQRAVAASGEVAFVTGAAAGASAAANDVDGITTIESPEFNLGTAGSTGWTLTFKYAFAHNARARVVDDLRVAVVGAPSSLFVQTGFSGNRNAVWTAASVNLDAYAGQTIRLVFQARDAGADSLIEAAIDDVRVYQAP